MTSKFDVRKDRIPLTALLLMAVLAAACGGTTETEGVMQGAPPADASAEAAAGAPEDGVQVVHVTVTSTGYSPEQITLQQGVPARLIFTRKASSLCTEQIRIPAFGIERTDLPVDEEVAVEFTPDQTGTFTFVCGMDMLRGTLVVES